VNRTKLTIVTLALCGASVLLRAQPYESKPAVAFDGTNFLVVWQSSESTEYHVRSSRVAQDGTVLDPGGFLCCTYNSGHGDPEVAFDGTNYLVAWWDDRNTPDGEVYGARVTPAGTVLDPDGFPIGLGTGELYNLAVSYGGSCYLVTWYTWQAVGEDCDVMAARVSPAGVLLDSVPIPVSAAATWETEPSVAFDGTNFLTVWLDRRAGQTRDDIYCARVSPAGTVLDPSGIAVCAHPHSAGSPRVCFGDNYFVAWGESDDIFGARITPDGVVLDSTGIAVCSAPEVQWTPTIAFDGVSFFTAWSDDRRPGGSNHDIFGGRISGAGVVLDSNGFVVGAASRMQRDPSVAFGTTCYLVAWEDQRPGGQSDIYACRVTPSGVALDTLGFPLVSQGIEEGEARATFKTPTTSIARGVLHLPRNTSASSSTSLLLDISGRSVMTLKAGSNDVSRLAPGVYFAQKEPSAVTKVIVTR